LYVALWIGNIELIDIQESIFSKEYYVKKHMIFIDYSAKALNNNIILNEELQEYKWLKPKDALLLNLNSSTKIFIQKS
jgi:hypothetical protein